MVRESVAIASFGEIAERVLAERSNVVVDRILGNSGGIEKF
jgi:hypothetical protein